MYDYNDQVQVKVSNVVNNQSYPVTIDEAKVQLGFTPDDQIEEPYISDLIKEATEDVEGYIQKPIAYTRFDVSIYDFSSDQIIIKEGNFNSLISITDASGTSITSKNIFPYKNKIRIDLNSQVTADPLSVSFYAGYTRSECPKLLKGIIRKIVFTSFNTERGTMSTQNVKDLGTYERVLGRYVNTSC